MQKKSLLFFTIMLVGLVVSFSHPIYAQSKIRKGGVSAATIDDPLSLLKKGILPAKITNTLQREGVKLQDTVNMDYIQSHASLAVREMQLTGIPASLILAQAIVETAGGTSKISQLCNNHFGIKCKEKRTCHEGHCYNFHDDSADDYFMYYYSVRESYECHSFFLFRSFYTAHLPKNKKKWNYKEWAYALEKGGYCTAPNYAKKLINRIERYNLMVLDAY